MKPLLAALHATQGIKALAHITGGGFPDNLPRLLPDGLGVRLALPAVPVPPVFAWLARTGGVAEAEMLRTFNCGIGMVAVVEEARVGEVMQALKAAGEPAIVMGEVVAGGAARVSTAGALKL